MPKENPKYYVDGKKVGELKKKRIHKQATQQKSIMDQRSGRIGKIDIKKIMESEGDKLK